MKIKSLSLLIILGSLGLVSCETRRTASDQEYNTTYRNHQTINESQPVPKLDYSQRRGALSAFYKINGVVYLPTCTIITDGPHIAFYNTVGPAVNLSNQMTSPNMAEADSIWPSNNDQTISITSNDKAVISEAHMTNITNARCPAEVPNMTFNQVVQGAIATQKQVKLEVLEQMRGNGSKSNKQNDIAPIEPSTEPITPKATTPPKTK